MTVGVDGWNEQRLKQLVQKMKLRRTPGQGKTPIHLSSYSGSLRGRAPLLAQIMRLDAAAWSSLGYTETDRISVVQYLGSLGCLVDEAVGIAAQRQQPLTLDLAKALLDAGAFGKEALLWAARYQRPLSFELAKLLIDAGAFDESALTEAARYQRPLPFDLAKLLVDAGTFDKGALSYAAICQSPLSFELAKLLIDAGCDPAAQSVSGWDSLVYLAYGGHPVDPQVTELFLSAGCRTDLTGCRFVDEKHRLRFNQILKEHAERKLAWECVPVDGSCDVDWDR